MEDGLFFVPEDGHVFAGGAGKCGLKHWPLEKIKRNKVHVLSSFHKIYCKPFLEQGFSGWEGSIGTLC
jgi:hypothetical protein